VQQNRVDQDAKNGTPPAQQKEEQKPPISVSVEGGYGLEGSLKLGIGEVKVGAAVKGELEVSPDGTKVSAKAEVGGNIGPEKLPGVELVKVTKNERGESEKLTLKPTKPGIAMGKSEATGGQGEIKIGVSAYAGWGAGVSVTIRPGATLQRVASAVVKFAADAIL